MTQVPPDSTAYGTCPGCGSAGFCWKETPTQRHMHCKLCGAHWTEERQDKE